MIDIEKFKPKESGVSDKYSANLYKFLRKQVKQKDFGQYVPKQIKVYWLENSRWDGSKIEFNGEITRLNQVIISPFGSKGLGYFLNTILTTGKAEQFSIPWTDQMVDITDWFFDRYEKVGRCIFDENHNRWLAHNENRFTHVNNTRKCNWCGIWQEKEIVKVQKIERKTKWNDVVSLK